MKLNLNGKYRFTVKLKEKFNFRSIEIYWVSGKFFLRQLAIVGFGCPKKTLGTVAHIAFGGITESC